MKFTKISIIIFIKYIKMDDSIEEGLAKTVKKRIKILVALLTAAMLAMNTPVISHAEIAGVEQSEGAPGENSGNLPDAPEKIEGAEESTQTPEGENRIPEGETL